MTVNIYLNTRRLTWLQGDALSDQTILDRLAPRATNDQGTDLSANLSVDLSMINPNQVGTYHGFVKANDPQTGDSNYVTFDLVVLPASQTTPQAGKQTSKHRRLKRWLAIGSLLAILGIGIASCQHINHVQKQAAQAEKTANQNTAAIKTNAQTNAALAKQLNELKGAQDQYRKDHDQAAYQRKILALEAENTSLQNQLANTGVLAQRMTRMGRAIADANNDPNNYQQALEATGMDQLMNRIQGEIDNFLAQH